MIVCEFLVCFSTSPGYKWCDDIFFPMFSIRLLSYMKLSNKLKNCFTENNACIRSCIMSTAIIFRFSGKKYTKIKWVKENDAEIF